MRRSVRYDYAVSAGGDCNYAAVPSVALAVVITILSAIVYGVTNGEGRVT